MKISLLCQGHSRSWASTGKLITGRSQHRPAPGEAASQLQIGMRHEQLQPRGRGAGGRGVETATDCPCISSRANRRAASHKSSSQQSTAESVAGSCPTADECSALVWLDLLGAGICRCSWLGFCCAYAPDALVLRQARF